MHKSPINQQALKKKYGNEQVFVVPAKELSHIPDGYTKEKHDTAIYSKFDQVGKYIYRYDAEGNRTFQQLIPYVIIYNPMTQKYLAYERTNGDSRLNHKYSLGFGGHIDISDGSQEVIFKGMSRELMEEVYYVNTSPAEFIGYVRSITCETGEHTGLAFLLRVSEATIRETDKHKGVWLSATELEENYFKFEEWGKLLIDYLVTHNYQLV